MCLFWILCLFYLAWPCLAPATDHRSWSEEATTGSQQTLCHFSRFSQRHCIVIIADLCFSLYLKYVVMALMIILEPRHTNCGTEWSVRLQLYIQFTWYNQFYFVCIFSSSNVTSNYGTSGNSSYMSGGGGGSGGMSSSAGGGGGSWNQYGSSNSQSRNSYGGSSSQRNSSGGGAGGFTLNQRRKSTGGPGNSGMNRSNNRRR